MKEFPLLLAEVRTIRHWLAEQACAAGLQPMRVGHAGIVASELLVNLIRHARPVPPTVVVRCQPGARRLTVTIEAAAHSFASDVAFHDAIRAPDFSDTTALDALPEGGMGLFLATQFTEELRYTAARDSRTPERFTFVIAETAA
ncbi:MAG: ATP-binding protein [Oceanococcaceae bacterium]